MINQLLFKDFQDIEQPVNVASVAKISPFRYPGGKTWFIPRLKKWLKNKPFNSIFIEPFAGGASASLTVGCENILKQIIFSELDENVAAVWETILSDKYNSLIEKINSFEISLENVQKLLSLQPKNKLDLAFQTIIKNRTSHGGILASGSGLIKFGENGKGVSSRWYPKTLSKRIQYISDNQFKFEFIHGDGLELIEKYLNKSQALFFVDPPYTIGGKNAGKRLYKHYNLDHEKLFYLMSKAKGDFILTYDISDEIKKICKKYSFSCKEIPMQNTHLAKMKEIIISRKLDWDM